MIDERKIDCCKPTLREWPTRDGSLIASYPVLSATANSSKKLENNNFLDWFPPTKDLLLPIKGRLEQNLIDLVSAKKFSLSTLLLHAGISETQLHVLCSHDDCLLLAFLCLRDLWHLYVA